MNPYPSLEALSHPSSLEDTDQEQLPSTLPQMPNDSGGNANETNSIADLANLHQQQLGNAPVSTGNQNGQLLNAVVEEGVK